MSFNLVKNPFVRVLTNSGSKTFSLREIFENLESIEDLDLVPNAKVAVTRLLIAIVDATNLIKNNESVERYHENRGDFISGCLKYLDANVDCFDLYGERPFLQAPFLVDTVKDPKTGDSVSSANMPMAFLNRIGKSGKALLDSDFVDDSTRPSDADLALGIIIQQCYSANYKAKNGKEISEASGVPFVLTSGVTPDFVQGLSSLMTFFVKGSNLLETLLYNTFSKKDVRDIFPKSNTEVRPVWELDNSSYKSITDDIDTLSYSHRLVSYTRLIRLLEEGSDMIYVGGLKYEDLPENTTYFKGLINKDGDPYRKNYDKLGSMWKSLDVISTAVGANPALVVGPRIQRILKAVNPPSIELESFGAGVSATSGLYYVKRWYTSSFKIVSPLDFFSSIGVRLRYRKAVGYSNYISGKLYAASERYFKELGITDKGVKKVKFDILRDKYWDLANKYKSLLEDPTKHKEWHTKIRRCSYEAFKLYNGTSFDTKKAYAIGFRTLKNNKGAQDGN